MSAIGETVIFAGSVLGALLAIAGAAFKLHKWYLRQNEQDEEIKNIRVENTLICYALSACLDGLLQLGCNHAVPDAKNRMDKYLNERAHGK